MSTEAINSLQNIDIIKDDLIAQIDKRLEDKIIEPTNAELLKKLISNAESTNEAIMIAELGTTYKRTGFHFDKRLEKLGNDIKYLKKNEALSFKNNSNALTHKLIIGDNYDALQQLLITHRGMIDVIYIDPPYGSDSMGQFAKTNYNNSITRDNLLSMLYPRLQLAKQLMKDSGVLYCSIDDRNQAYVKGLLDEVFGENNFIENFIWYKNSTKNLSKTTSTNHEYILCYSKNIKLVIQNNDLFRIQKAGLAEVKQILEKANKDGLSPKEAEQKLKDFYKNHKELKGISCYNRVDYGPTNMQNVQKCLKAYRLDNTSAPKSTGRAATYEVLHPIDGLPCICPTSGWRYTWETMQEHIKNGLIEFYNDHNHVPAFKRYLDKVETEVQKSIIQDFKDGKKELAQLFGESPFDNPKPTTLIKTLIRCCNKNATILDFFAGSGTAGQAVLELNQEDGGNRHFILCTNNEITDNNPNGIAYDVTSKRLKRVMSGKCYDGSSNFKWLEKNEPYGDNLDVYDIVSVNAAEQAEGKSPFDVIDETCYDMPKFTSVQEKIAWVCNNFENTQKYIKEEE